MASIRSFFRSQTIFCVALFLTVGSMFIVPPSAEYIEYIDFRTLALLFCQMTVISGMVRTGLADWISGEVRRRFATTRRAGAAMVFLSFFSAMLITNDVALMSFVPLTLAVFSRPEQERDRITVLVFQTIGANIGSMFTPFGNPQNLYLFGASGMGAGEFLLLTGKYTLVSGVLLALSLRTVRNAPLPDEPETKGTQLNGKKNAIYALLLLVCVLGVLRVLPVILVVGIVAAAFLVLDRRAFSGVNYMLLLTFIVFFILAGNIRHMSAFRELIERTVAGRTVLTSVLTSQVISNVPAAMLLSAFSDDWSGLIVGTNLGGLGTLIASMASLITWQYYAQTPRAAKGKYFLWFTLWNLGFLVLLLPATLL